MPIFEIEQYEIHAQKFQVEASSEAEAISKVLNGEADAMDNEQEYIEVATDIGLPVDEHRDLVEELRRVGTQIGDDIIPSIRSVKEVGYQESRSYPLLK